MGFKITATGRLPTPKLAKVLEVGSEELIVEYFEGFLNNVSKVSKHLCQPVVVKNLRFPPVTPAPSIGDLVLYYSRNYKNEETKIVGHLTEMEVSVDGEVYGYIDFNSEKKKFKLKDLLVLETKVKN